MATTLELVRKYEPVLCFSKDRRGRPESLPMPAWRYVHGCGLRRKRSGWEKEPGSTLLYDLGLVNASHECYLAYGIADLSTDPQVGSALLMAMDVGLEVARPPDGGAPPVQPFGFSPQADDEEAAVAPRLILTPSAADELEARLEDWGGVERQRLDVESIMAQVDLGELDVELEVPPVPVAGTMALGGAPRTLEAVTPRSLAALPKALRERALAKYAPYRERYPPVYHYALRRDRGYLVIQYWFLYAFNDWAAHGGYNDHEGDWEVVCVFLDDNDRPRAVAYSRHVIKPDVATWDELSQTPGAVWQGTHPVVYVGCGSHANYLKSGVHRHWVYEDYALGNDLSVGPGRDLPWGAPNGIAGKAWNLRFAGNWGALVKRWLGLSLPGTAGPTGPAQKGRQWNEAALWAGLPPLG